jgi:hypothetical protein
MKKKSGQSVTFEKEGYKSQTMRLTTGLQPWFWGNILIGGLIGSTTDGITGAVHEYSPSQFMVNLAPIDGSIDTSKSEAKMFIIANYKDILEELNTTQGQYLSSLLVLLRVAEEHRADAVKGIKIWADATKDIPNFANMVVTHYMDYRK